MFTNLEAVEDLLHEVNAAARHPERVQELTDFLECEIYGGEIACMNEVSQRIMENFLGLLESSETAVAIESTMFNKAAGQKSDDLSAIRKVLDDTAAQLEATKKMLEGMEL